MPTLIQILLALTKRLFPTGRAFRTSQGLEVEDMNKGLIESEALMAQTALDVLDQILADNDNFTTQNASDWERRLAIRASESTSLDDRKLAILRKYAQPGDIPARSHFLFLQREIQAAGFTDVFVHENRQVSQISGTWAQVGNSFSPAEPSGARFIVALTETRIAYFDEGVDKLRTYDFDGLDWAQVGNDFSYDADAGNRMARLTNSRIAIIGQTTEDLRTYDFDGTNWSQVGNDLNIPGVGRLAITGLTESRIAFVDDTNQDLRTYDFDGTDWAQVGNDLNIVGMISPDIATLTSARIAFIDSSNDDLRTYDFDGLDWAQVGNDLNIPSVPNFAVITGLTSSRIAYIDSTNDDLRTYDFDGTDWVEVGTGLSISGSGFEITAMNSTRVAFYDNASVELRTYDLSLVTTYETIPLEAVFGNQMAGGMQMGQGLQMGPTLEDLDIVANYIDIERDSLFVLPDDKRATFFVGGEVLGDPADVPEERRDEFRQLILFVKPLQTVGLLLINYT